MRTVALWTLLFVGMAALVLLGLALVKWYKNRAIAGNAASAASPAVAGVACLTLLATVAGAIASAPPVGVLPWTNLDFQQPTGPVKACATFQGTGKIPNGSDLLIFDRAIGGHFHFDGKAVPTSKGWQTPSVSVGAEQVEVAAVLVPSTITAYLNSIVLVNSQGEQLDSDSASWKSLSLLPGDTVEPPLIVMRDPADEAYC